MIKILILGGGFGGIRTALELDKKLRDRKDIQITLLDRNHSQTFQPSLYEVASAYGMSRTDPFYQKLKDTVAISYAEIFKNTRVQTMQAEIASADLDTKVVRTTGPVTLMHEGEGIGAEMHFDYLVIALGSEVSTYGIEGVSEYAYKFKTLDDAIKLFEDVEQDYLNAEKNQQQLPLKFLIGGAGFNGIELASELSRCAEHIAHKHNIHSRHRVSTDGHPMSEDNNLKQCSDITLIEAMPQVLPMISEHERGIARARLQKLGINILENAAIEKVLDKNRLQLKNGQELNADFIIWTAGIKAPEILKSLTGLQLDDKGKIIVNKYLQTGSLNQGSTLETEPLRLGLEEKTQHPISEDGGIRPQVFAVGDSITFLDPKTQKSIPQMAFVAMEQGRVAAENIANLVNRHPMSIMKEYEPSYNFWIVPMGGKYALAHIGSWRFTGKLGYLIRELVDLRYFLAVLSVWKAVGLVWHRLSIFLKND